MRRRKLKDNKSSKASSSNASDSAKSSKSDDSGAPLLTDASEQQKGGTNATSSDKKPSGFCVSDVSLRSGLAVADRVQTLSFYVYKI